MLVCDLGDSTIKRFRVEIEALILQVGINLLLCGSMRSKSLLDTSVQKILFDMPIATCRKNWVEGERAGRQRSRFENLTHSGGILQR